jgi:hypothetical protein
MGILVIAALGMALTAGKVGLMLVWGLTEGDALGKLPLGVPLLPPLPPALGRGPPLLTPGPASFPPMPLLALRLTLGLPSFESLHATKNRAGSRNEDS